MIWKVHAVAPAVAILCSVAVAFPDAGRTSPSLGAVSATIELRTHVISGIGNRVLLDFLLENRSRNEIVIHRTLVYSACQSTTRALHLVLDDGTELRYKGVLVASGVPFAGVAGEDAGQYEILRPGEKISVRSLDISAAYEFPQGTARIRGYWEGGGFRSPGGWVGIRSRDVWLDYVPVSVRPKERPDNRVGKNTTGQKTRTLWCEQAYGSL